MPEEDNKVQLENNYWQKKSLTQMNDQEWENLCDGCGLCCLLKLEDEDTNELYYTSVACKLLDTDACRCTKYEERRQHVPGCIRLNPHIVATIPWLPETCAYRLVAFNKDLPWWHHLKTGSRETVHLEGMSVRNRVVSEADVDEQDIEDYVLEHDKVDGLLESD